jgi:hypothetical protein
MEGWAAVGSSSITDSRRWDAEFFVTPYNDFLNEIFERWHQWESLESISSKLTSGHTPYHHDVSEGDTPFVTVECVDT